MEFVQFHPTALDSESTPKFLITEALRGEGAYLLDCDLKRFMPDIHPLAELAPRDVNGLFFPGGQCLPLAMVWI
jgi:L-aspartate oxidase